MTTANIVISAIGLVLTFAGFAAGRLSSASKRGIEQGIQKAEIDHIKKQLDKLVQKTEEREKTDKIAREALRIAMTEHNRINDHLRCEHGRRSGLSDYQNTQTVFN